MQATLEIDDDVLEAAQLRAQQQGLPLGKLPSDLARQSLGLQHRSNFGTPIIPPSGNPVSNDHVQRLREEENI